MSGSSRVLVTGAHGKVGRALLPTLQAAGYAVRATDLARPVWDRVGEDEPEDYWQADLVDAGAADAVTRGCDVVVHTAAIPQPIHNPPHVVFGNNLMCTFNLLEAAVAAGVRRFVHFSSETVLGHHYALAPIHPEYLPVDETYPPRPQDPYAQSKWFGELLCDRVVERAPIRCTSLRPSWVMDQGSYERNLGPVVRDPSVLVANYGGYVDVDDVCDAVVLAIETDLPGHEVFYLAAPDGIGGHPLEEIVHVHHGLPEVEIRPLPRPDASPLLCTRANELLGWTARRSWRDALDDEGRLRR